MAYCTQLDLYEQIPQEDLTGLTDDSGQGAIDISVIARAIADADAEIDAWIGVRYSLPLAATPALVRKWSVDLAICNLYARRHHLKLPDHRKERCDAVHRWLEQVAQGKLAISAPDADKSDAGDGVAASTTRDDRIFTLGRDSDGSAGSLDNY